MNLDAIDEKLSSLEEMATGWWSDIAPEKRRFMEAINISKQLLAVVRREGTSVTIDSVSVVEERRKEVKRETYEDEEFVEPPVAQVANKKKVYKAVENTEEEQASEREYVEKESERAKRSISRDEKIILEMSEDIRKKDLIIESMYEHIEGAKKAKDKTKEVTQLYNALIKKHNAMIDMYNAKESELKEFYGKLISTNDLLVEQTNKVNKYEKSWMVKKFLK